MVAFDLRTRKIVWRTEVDGYRADHMAISPDGSRLLVIVPATQSLSPVGFIASPW